MDTSALWYFTRGGPKLDQGWGVDVDSQGNVYFATFQQPPTARFADMVIYKFGPGATELWHTRWGGGFMEKAFVVTVSEPFVYVGGLTYKSAGLTDADMAVLALNADDGSIAWEYTWGQGFGYEEVDGLAADGDFIYVSGWTTGATTSNDAALLKLDRAGKLVWARSWGSNGWDQADGQLVVDQDSIYFAGRYNGRSIALGGQGYIARFSKDTGEPVAQQTWGGPIFTDALGLTSDGVYLYAVGLTLDAGNGGQIFLRKYDKNLTLQWERIWGGHGSESARAAAVDSAGHIFVAGETDSQGSGGLDIALLKYDADGNLLWSKTWGGPQNEGALGIALSGDYAYIAAKAFSFGEGQDDALLLKADANSGQFSPASEPSR